MYNGKIHVKYKKNIKIAAHYCCCKISLYFRVFIEKYGTYMQGFLGKLMCNIQKKRKMKRNKYNKILNG